MQLNFLIGIKHFSLCWGARPLLAPGSATDHAIVEEPKLQKIVERAQTLSLYLSIFINLKKCYFSKWVSYTC